MKYVGILTVIFLPVLLILLVISTEIKDKYLIGALTVLAFFLCIGMLISDYFKMKHASGLTIPMATSHLIDTPTIIMK
jgi:hypothetical protein